MMRTLFPFLYASIVLILLWQAFRMMSRGFALEKDSAAGARSAKGDRTGRLTIHPELLDQEGRITDEELLTVRFSEENEFPHSEEKPTE